MPCNEAAPAIPPAKVPKNIASTATVSIIPITNLRKEVILTPGLCSHCPKRSPHVVTKTPQKTRDATGKMYRYPPRKRTGMSCDRRPRFCDSAPHRLARQTVAGTKKGADRPATDNRPAPLSGGAVTHPPDSKLRAPASYITGALDARSIGGCYAHLIINRLCCYPRSPTRGERSGRFKRNHD
jgi:hypothetical protein